ncbi:hypothetical protein SCLARK_001649 [Spiroplasma clarkii]|uniref:Lipoprotein n=1 Tax=Spiroplasma clarkii TaxID=2139 RepID=A0A1Y0L2A2_9MOLU|nr:lipoprotein [Spiroplasma clarkii]ARU92117.1 hypothetical protein SCLARK_001649 [Spiroplasma clarkii]ATX71455.1 hypothetical protein SCLAR_v1c11550 [Spiroplasma clarkii]
MKKLLAFFAATGFVASTSTNVIACGDKLTEEEKEWEKYSSIAMLFKDKVITEMESFVKSETLSNAFQKVFEYNDETGKLNVNNNANLDTVEKVELTDGAKFVLSKQTFAKYLLNRVKTKFTDYKIAEDKQTFSNQGKMFSEELSNHSDWVKNTDYYKSLQNQIGNGDDSEIYVKLSELDDFDPLSFDFINNSDWPQEIKDKKLQLNDNYLVLTMPINLAYVYVISDGITKLDFLSSLRDEAANFKDLTSKWRGTFAWRL